MDTILFSSKSENWETPMELFNGLDKIFHFTLDACANVENCKVKNFYSKEQNGLNKQWMGNVWCNPPYGKTIYKWIEKASNEIMKPYCRNIVLLLPARVDTKWFHDFIYRKHKIYFIKGRLVFNEKQNVTNSAPFPSMIVWMMKKTTKE